MHLFPKNNKIGFVALIIMFYIFMGISSYADQNYSGEEILSGQVMQNADSSKEDLSKEKNKQSAENIKVNEADKNAGEGEESNPTIISIVIVGNKLISTEEITKVISSRVGALALEPKLFRDERAVMDMGYFTDVSYDLIPVEDGVKLVFTVLENPIISKIDISGNTIVETAKLRSLMETQEGKILNTQTLKGDIIDLDNYYNETLGYIYRPTHVYKINWTSDGVLTLNLIEGMVVNEIKIEGNTAISTPSLMALIKTQKGELLNSKKFSEDLNRISEYYETSDYLILTIEQNIEFKDGIIVVRIIEQVCQEIKIEGNQKTKDFVILRNIRTKAGQVLRSKKLKRDYERIRNLGYFESVEIIPEPGSEPGKVIIVWKIKEQKTGLATLGLGYQGGGSGGLRPGLTGAISVTERNWRGRGQSVNVNWQRGVNIDAAGISYSDPAINDKQDSIGVNIYNNNVFGLRQPVYGTSPLQYALYNDHRSGGSVSYGILMNDDCRLFFTLRKESIELTQNTESSYTVNGLGQGESNGFITGVAYDTRDDIYDPYEGFYLNGSYQLNGGLLSGDYNYNKFQAEYRRYFPLKKENLIAMRLWGGRITGTSPITDYFYVGGTDTIRGYPDNAFYGKNMVVGSVEYRFPIGNIQYLKGVLFVDAGNAWFDENQTEMNQDAGVGIRLVFPKLGLGVIRVDYATGSDGARTSIGIGQTF